MKIKASAFGHGFSAQKANHSIWAFRTSLPMIFCYASGRQVSVWGCSAVHNVPRLNLRQPISAFTH